MGYQVAPTPPGVWLRIAPFGQGFPWEDEVLVVTLNGIDVGAWLCEDPTNAVHPFAWRAAVRRRADGACLADSGCEACYMGARRRAQEAAQELRQKLAM